MIYSTMKIKDVLEIFKTYNKWRRGAEIPMPEPQKIGQAIDSAIEYMEKTMDEKIIAAPVQYEPIYKHRFVLDFGIENFHITVTSVSELKHENGEWKDLKIDFIGICEIETLKNIMLIKDKISKEGNINFIFKLLNAIGETVDSYIISSNSIDFSLDNYDVNDDSYVRPWILFKNIDFVNETYQ